MTDNELNELVQLYKGSKIAFVVILVSVIFIIIDKDLLNLCLIFIVPSAIFIVFAIYYLIKFSLSYEPNQKSSSIKMEDTNNMDGLDFERWCAIVLKDLGFNNVDVTRGSGDQGADILAEKDGKTYAIQCKRFNGKVGNKAVQEAIAGREYYKKDIAVVMTNSGFSNSAIDLANETNVKLWDRNTIEQMLKVVNLTK